MFQLLRRLRGNQSGTSIIEFGIAGPVVLMAIIGCVEFGRFFWIRNTLEHAIEEAGRFAVINKSASASTIQTQVRNKVMGISPSVIVVTVTDTAGPSVTYRTIVATTTASGTTPAGYVSLVGGFLPVTRLPLRAETRVVVPQ
ncbi:MAG TPA: TadE/TadG family type IV pilus assembly protein [Vineibacter sp.]|nr:TadE/TadG family type IV pilus assembly protein [Vineibacter sp.]